MDKIVKGQSDPGQNESNVKMVDCAVRPLILGICDRSLSGQAHIHPTGATVTRYYCVDRGISDSGGNGYC